MWKLEGTINSIGTKSSIDLKMKYTHFTQFNSLVFIIVAIYWFVKFEPLSQIFLLCIPLMFIYLPKKIKKTSEQVFAEIERNINDVSKDNVKAIYS